MPFLKCVYSGDIEMRDDILKALSSALAEGLGKPEAVCFVQVEHSTGLMFSGSKEPCAMINIQSIGGNFEPIVRPITDILVSIGGVLQSRVFINFSNFEMNAWGVDGVTAEEHYGRK
jgi:phenylpyruvate tautomerase PptA (4-oxalocrotonate tautomerase family)